MHHDEHPEFLEPADEPTPAPTAVRLTPEQRLQRFVNIVDRLRARGALGSFDRRHRINAFATLLPPRGSDLAPIRFCGARLTGPHYLDLKAAFEHMGEMLKDPVSHDWRELRAVMSGVTRYISQDNLENALARWNDECANRDECSFMDCGHLENNSDSHDTYDGTRCVSCFEDDEYVWVENTGDYRRAEEAYEWSDGGYRTYEEDDDDDDDDDDDSAGGHVMGYSTNVLDYCRADASVAPSSYGEFLTGVELEVAPREDRTEVARHTARAFTDYAILKNDGSLDSDDTGYCTGFEIVTAPRTITEHVERFAAWTPHEELRAWDAGCCGMHVHISSKAFTQATLGKFIEFINAKENDDLIYEIAGRHPQRNSQAGTYCRREGSMVMGNPKKNIEGKSTSRYHMVNSTNLDYYEAARLGLGSDHAQKAINTIELRIFRATLSKPRLLAQLEFAHAAVMFCRWSSMRQLRRAHFIAWLHDCAGVYPHLAKWFGVKANKKEVLEHPPVREYAEV